MNTGSPAPGFAQQCQGGPTLGMSVGIIQATRIRPGLRRRTSMLADALRAAVKRSLGALVAALWRAAARRRLRPWSAVELYLEATHRIELRPSAQVLQEPFFSTTDNPRSVCTVCASAAGHCRVCDATWMQHHKLARKRVGCQFGPGSVPCMSSYDRYTSTAVCLKPSGALLLISLRARM